MKSVGAKQDGQGPHNDAILYVSKRPSPNNVVSVQPNARRELQVVWSKLTAGALGRLSCM